MHKKYASIIAPFIAIILLMLSFSFFVSYISIFLKLNHYTEFVVGIVQAAYYVGLLIGTLRIERLIRRTGHIRYIKYRNRFASRYFYQPPSVGVSCDSLQDFAWPGSM